MGLFFANSATAEDAKPAQWLFIHTAETAEMTSATTLVMPVTREIFAFTDRPSRQHAYMNAHEYASLWDEGEGDTFKADPPNAVLTWVDGEEVKEAEVVVSDVSISENSRTLLYTLSVEEGALPVSGLISVSLFVDDNQATTTMTLSQIIANARPVVFSSKTIEQILSLGK